MPCNAAQVAELIVAIRAAFASPGSTKEIVWILSGTHGTPTGDLDKEKDFFYEDKTLEGQIYKTVNVFGFTRDDGTFVENRWREYMGKKGVIILAWCYSEKSRTGWMLHAGLTT